MTAETFPKSVKVVVEIGPNILAGRGDASQLCQVLLNLCVNARDAMRNGGALTLAARNFHADELFATIQPDAHAGDYARLTVADIFMEVHRALAGG